MTTTLVTGVGYWLGFDSTNFWEIDALHSTLHGSTRQQHCGRDNDRSIHIITSHTEQTEKDLAWQSDCIFIVYFKHAQAADWLNT